MYVVYFLNSLFLVIQSKSYIKNKLVLKRDCVFLVFWNECGINKDKIEKYCQHLSENFVGIFYAIIVCVQQQQQREKRISFQSFLMRQNVITKGFHCRCDLHVHELRLLLSNLKRKGNYRWETIDYNRLSFGWLNGSQLQ